MGNIGRQRGANEIGGLYTTEVENREVKKPEASKSKKSQTLKWKPYVIKVNSKQFY